MHELRITIAKRGHTNEKTHVVSDEKAKQMDVKY